MKRIDTTPKTKIVIDYKKVEDELSRIPTGKDVVELQKRIEQIEWFKPQEKPDEDVLKDKVTRCINSFNIVSKHTTALSSLANIEDWVLAMDTPQSQIWSYVYNAAIEMSNYYLFHSKRKAIYESSIYINEDQPLIAKHTLDFEIVKDLMQAQGYRDNPFKKLLSIWEMGLCPNGIMKDNKFWVYYVSVKK